MQCSNKSKTIFIRTAKILVFLTIIIGINICICHYLSPSAHKSNEMWEYYYSRESADTIFVGSSVTDMIKEFSIDEFTGRKSVNMGTPSQYFATSAKLIELSTKEKPIDTIILMMGFDALERDEDLKSTIAIEKAYYDTKVFEDKIIGFIFNNLEYSLEERNITKSNSVNKWMSWPVNCIVSFDEIKTNYEIKMHYKDYVNQQRQMITDYDQSKYNRTSMPMEKELDAATRSFIKNISAINISENSLVCLKQICEYCIANNILLFVVVSPHRSDYQASFEGDYEKINELVKNYVESSGCMYLNLNDQPDVTRLMIDDYFTDLEHVNNEGIEIASGIMSDILNLLTGKRK